MATQQDEDKVTMTENVDFQYHFNSFKQKATTWDYFKTSVIDTSKNCLHNSRRLIPLLFKEWEESMKKLEELEKSNLGQNVATQTSGKVKNGKPPRKNHKNKTQVCKFFSFDKKKILVVVLYFSIQS